MESKKELLYDGTYYDVTNWIKRHPGGKIIELFTSTGEDSTHAVQQLHNRSTKKVMSIMKSLPHRSATVKDLKLDPVKQERHKALTKDFLELFHQLQAEGMFKPDYMHVFLRLSEIVLLYLIGFSLVQLQPQNILMRTWGILITTLALGRASWIMHEAGHHSVTGIPKVDRFIQSAIYGFMFGLSASRWVCQHSRHHSMLQHVKHDVDLHTVPLFALHKDVVENAQDGKGVLIQNQKWLLPFNGILAVLFWSFYLHPRYCLYKREYLDLLFMTLHYIHIFLFFGLVNFSFVICLASVYFIVNTFLSHSHLPVSENATHWVEYSLCHTTNIRSSWWVDYWMGYLNYQIEHHLFPTMPHFRNKLCRDRVKALAKKHNLPYNLFSYREAVVKTFDNLGSVSKELALQD